MDNHRLLRTDESVPSVIDVFCWKYEEGFVHVHIYHRALLRIPIPEGR